MAIRIPKMYGLIFRKTEKTIALHASVVAHHKSIEALSGDRYWAAYEDQHLFAFPAGMGANDTDLAIHEYEHEGFSFGEDFWISGSGFIRAQEKIMRDGMLNVVEIRWLKQIGKFVHYSERSPCFHNNEVALSTVSRFLFGPARFNKPQIPAEELFLMWGSARRCR